MSFKEFKVIPMADYDRFQKVMQTGGGNVQHEPDENSPQNNNNKIIELLPTYYRNKAKTILHFIKVNSDFTIDGVTGGHAIDLIKWAIKRNSKKPHGSDEFLALLKKVNVPTSVYDNSPTISASPTKHTPSVERKQTLPTSVVRKRRESAHKTAIQLKAPKRAKSIVPPGRLNSKLVSQKSKWISLSRRKTARS